MFAWVNFQSKLVAVEAFGALHGQHIYDAQIGMWCGRAV